MKKPAAAITPAQYRAFQTAYDFMNNALFDGSLPHVLVTLQRHANTRGYFAGNRFAARGAAGGESAHELAMNPDYFTGRTDREIISTLVHEMAHVWQATHGTPPRRAYHDRQWAAKMHEVGLHPSDTGAPGGKEIGQKVSHFIVDGGAFDRAYARLEARGFALQWQSAPTSAATKAKKASKTKYTCPACGANAWAKPGAALICGACYAADAEDEDDEDAAHPVIVMQPEAADEDDAA